MLCNFSRFNQTSKRDHIERFIGKPYCNMLVKCVSARLHIRSHDEAAFKLEYYHGHPDQAQMKTDRSG